MPQLGRWFTPDPAEQFNNPYLAMGTTERQEYIPWIYLASGAPLGQAVMYVDPDGEFAFLIPFLIGARISVITNGISNSIHGGEFFDGAGRAALIGGISGVLSAGIGSAAGGMMGAEKIAFQTMMHGHLGGMTSAVTGGKYTAGFLAGASGSLAATGTGAAMENMNSNLAKGATVVGTGALMGGLGAEIAGGNFWDGVRTGAISAGLNHLAHSSMSGGSEPPASKGVDGWKTFSGIAATAGGVVMIGGGILAVVTPGGQILAVYLISTGAVVTGFGAPTAIDGLNGGTREDLGGPAYTIDKRMGGEGNLGEIIDLSLGGVPASSLSKGIFGASLLFSSVGKFIFEQDPLIYSLIDQNEFILQPDNTKVYMNLNSVR